MSQVNSAAIRLCMRTKNVFLQLLLATIFLVSLAYGSSSAALGLSSLYSKLNIQGIEYLSTCEPEELEILHGELLRSSVVRPERAWAAIHTLLCGSNNIQTRQLIEKIVVPRIQQTSTGTGDKPEMKMSRRTEEFISALIREGKAWNTSVQSDDGKLLLHYQTNEACMSSVRLAYTRSAWKIVELVEACD